MTHNDARLKRFIGREYDKVNCWQLAREFYLYFANVELKSYHEGVTPGRKDTQNLIFANIGDFEKVDTPQFGDIILVRLMGVESHMGIYIDSTKFLHSIEKVGSVLENLSRYENMIVGYYRLKGVVFNDKA